MSLAKSERSKRGRGERRCLGSELDGAPQPEASPKADSRSHNTFAPGAAGLLCSEKTS